MKHEKLKYIKEIATQNNWRFEKTSKTHWKFFSPCGKHIVLVSSNEANAITTKRIFSDFKRAGLVLDNLGG